MKLQRGGDAEEGVIEPGRKRRFKDLMSRLCFHQNHRSLCQDMQQQPLLIISFGGLPILSASLVILPGIYNKLIVYF